MIDSTDTRTAVQSVYEVLGSKHNVYYLVLRILIARLVCYFWRVQVVCVVGVCLFAFEHCFVFTIV